MIPHEPTFWSATDVVSDLKDDPLSEYNVNFYFRMRVAKKPEWTSALAGCGHL